VDSGRDGLGDERQEPVQHRRDARPSAAEAVDVVWAMTRPDDYIELVFERGWSAAHYESWLARTLHRLCLQGSRR
jgi:hypothetical protein